MQSLHSILFVCHILVGSCALLLFWVPVASRKGSLDHRKFGRYYAMVMYAVALTGAVMAGLVLADPMTIKGHLLTNPSEQLAFIDRVRQFWSFLLYLSLITFVSVRHGLATLTHRQSLVALRKSSYWLPIALLGFSGIAVLVMGVQHGRWLHIIFGCLGTMISVDMLRYIFGYKNAEKQWLVEHLGAMIGSGIGAYTAFLAFGGRQIFTELGSWQLVFWIAPGVIGSIMIARFARRYHTPQREPKPIQLPQNSRKSQ